MRKPLYKKREVVPLSQSRKVNQMIPGMTFGDWTIVGNGTKQDYLLCKCICGTKREVHVYSLTTGKSVSCGCRRSRKNKRNADA